jgi:hypothetical protein
VVFDASARRLSVLDPSGKYVRSFTLQAPFEGGGSVTLVTATRDGAVIVGYSEIRQMAPRPEAVYFGQRLFNYSTTGELRSTNGLAVPATEHFVQAVPKEMGGVAYWNLAFGRAMTVRGDSGTLFTGDGTESTFQERDQTGAVIRTHRLQRTPEPVTNADKEAWSNNTLGSSQGNQRLISERMIAEMPWPKTKPVYRRFEMDGVGRMWIELYPDVGQTQFEWLRLDLRTRTAVSVTFADRFRPLAFTSSHVYGVWRDSDDVEHVRVYALDLIR